jgi:hypothetical protein
VGKPLRALIVEDVERDALLVLRELKRGGFDVTSERVDTPEAMTAALAEQPWEIVISDYSMPRFSAPMALEIVKALKLDLPFIIVSGTIGEEIAVEAIRAGARDFMVKGKLTRLIPAVERELREAEARRRLGRTEHELRTSEKRLEMSERRFQNLFESAPEALVITDRRGAITLVNHQAERMFGWTRQELLDQPLEMLLPQPKREGHVALREGYLKDAVPRAMGGGRANLHGVRKNGSVFPVEISLSPMESDGDLLVAAAVRDITERVQLQAQLLQAQKMESVGRLAGGVAHDFNNLLSVIIGWTGMALEELPAGHAVRPSLEEVLKAGEGAAGLTRQLLAFSRQQVVEPTLFSVNDLVVEADKMLRRLIGEDIEFVTRTDPELGTVKMDRGQLEQVLLNLVVNARDAMPEGGKLTIESANVVLDAEYPRKNAGVTPGEYVMLAVSDSGVGMNEEVKARLFEPFFTTKEREKGTGLGLATCYGIAKQAGGHIAAYSEEGLGTTMKVYLPRSREATPPAARHREKTPVHGVETILLVEDDPAVRRVTARMLEAQGYRVLSTGSGKEALRVIEDGREPWHLLLTDVVLSGGMSGRALADRVRALKPDVKVLFVSGYTSDVTILHGLLEQGITLVQKPFTAESLGGKVRQVLDAG